MTMFYVAAVTVGGSLLSGKIASNRGQKGPIGTGTAPTLEPGAPIEIAPVQGTEVLDFGAATEGFAEPEIDRAGQEQELIQQLIEAGYDPEALGIAGLAFGGPLYRSNGGETYDYRSLYNLANRPRIELSDLLNLKPRSQSYGLYQDSVPEFLRENDYGFLDAQEATGSNVGPLPPKGHKEIASVGQPDFKAVAEIDGLSNMPEVETGIMAQGAEWFEGLEPGVQSAMLGATKTVLGELFREEPKGSQVMTQTLPGNSSRRRAAQMNIKPIQGSVRNAADGGVLDRQMFQPSRETYMGGPMNGPGGPKDDLIPVMASNGEYMLSKAAVDAAGDGSHAMGIANLNRFNDMGNKRYGN
tara:strand:- start:771 stop:1838 length:1068 start_codon:yes stop_codon:yes gene_type:complete